LSKLKLSFLLGAAPLLIATTWTSTALACGGIVKPAQAVAVQTNQRAFVSVRSNDTTDMVIQLALPSASASFGAITPVYGKPTLDPTPIDVNELDALDESTRPKVNEAPAGGGCGCGSAPGAAARDKSGGVNVIQMVDIGPVTAVVLTADSSADLAAWLTQNGFEVPAADQAVIDTYLGTDRYFIAFKRNAAAPPGPSSVGVSFVVPGDQRGYALTMARIGAGTQLGIQVFIAAPESFTPKGSAPLAPFATLTLNDLSKSKLLSDYSGAVFDAVAKKQGKAFVVEGVFHAAAGWRDGLGARLFDITEPGQILTRLSTVLSPDSIGEDVSFMGEAPANVPNEVATAGAVPTPGTGRRGLRFLPLALLAAAAAARALRRALRVAPRLARA
jgi:Uncharacterized protein conserved in bacteria (DUF2330)